MTGGSSRGLSEEEIQRIVDTYDEIGNMTKVAAKLGHGKDTVQKYLHQRHPDFADRRDDSGPGQTDYDWDIPPESTGPYRQYKPLPRSPSEWSWPSPARPGWAAAGPRTVSADDATIRIGPKAAADITVEDGAVASVTVDARGGITIEVDR